MAIYKVGDAKTKEDKQRCWLAVKERYENGDNISQIARDHRICDSAIHMKAKRGGWVKIGQAKIKNDATKHLHENGVVNTIAEIVEEFNPELVNRQGAKDNEEKLEYEAAILTEQEILTRHNKKMQVIEHPLQEQNRKLQKNGMIITYDILLKLKEELSKGRNASDDYIKKLKEGMLICEKAGVTADKVASSLGLGQIKTTVQQQFNFGDNRGSGSKNGNVPPSASGNLLTDDPINEMVKVHIELSELQQQMLDDAAKIEDDFQKNKVETQQDEILAKANEKTSKKK